MAEDDKAGRQWIVEPPAAGEVTFHMAFGEGVELTEEQEAALSELMRTLESSDAEVTGHAHSCSAYSVCTDKSCKPVRCSTFVCHGLTSLPVNISAGGTAWNLMGSFGPGTA